MSVGAQTRLVGEPTGARLELETTGRVIRPLFEPLTAIVDECKLGVTPDGIHTSAVDKGNVAQAAIEAPARAFDAYNVDAEETTIGMDLERTTGQLSHARKGKGTDDAVQLAMDGSSTSLEIEREYGDTRVVRRDEWLNINPDSIRQEPDVPDLDLPWQAEVDAHALAAAASAAASVSDHVKVHTHDESDLVFTATHKNHDGDRDAGHRTVIEGVAEPTRELDDGEADASAMFSLDYLTDLFDALVAAKADSVTVRWSDEFPLRAAFERTDDDGDLLYEGHVLLAPRIESDTTGGDDL